MSALSTFLQERSTSLLVLISLGGSYVFYILIHRVITLHRHSKIIKANGCKPIPAYPHTDPVFGLDIFFENFKLSKKGGLMPKIQERYARINGGVNSFT